MNKPLISIITVVYNDAPQLEETIRSVVNQPYSQFEYIVIDGGSTDQTVDIIKKYVNHISYWVSEKDNGVYDAMNKALAIAKGNWIYFLGSGDVLYPVLEQIAAMLTNDRIIYYGDVYRRDTNTVYDGPFSPFKFAVANICHQAIFYPADVFSKYRYNTKYKIQADYALNMQCYGDQAYRFHYLPVTICSYEGAGYSDTMLDLVFFKDKINLVKANFPLLVYAYALTRRTLAKIVKPNRRYKVKEAGIDGI
jgi:glycosyltransferase involved in cell wall biosynthesis